MPGTARGVSEVGRKRLPGGRGFAAEEEAAMSKQS